MSNVCGFGNYLVLAKQDEQTFDSLRQQVSMTAAAFKQINNGSSDRYTISLSIIFRFLCS
ncbi:MAG: hypothetical protein QNJ72_19110 [Pleurocapsa sp. MO_226.B13]|nr:hypothetical protein [Pleurocapsa sp. MO_226.B13]